MSHRTVLRTIAHRAMAHHGASLVYVYASTFAAGAVGEHRLPPEAAALILRLQRAGVPVVVLRRGDDLGTRLGASELKAAVG